MCQSGNLGTQSLTHFLVWILNLPILVLLLTKIGTLFQSSAPLKQKLFLAKVSSEFGMRIFPFLLSLLRILARYSGSPLVLILKIWISVWYAISWFTDNQSNLSYITPLGDLGGDLVTICAALFCSTCRSPSCPLSSPPMRGRQYNRTLLNIP